MKNLVTETLTTHLSRRKDKTDLFIIILKAKLTKHNYYYKSIRKYEINSPYQVINSEHET